MYKTLDEMVEQNKLKTAYYVTSDTHWSRINTSLWCDKDMRDAISFNSDLSLFQLIIKYHIVGPNTIRRFTAMYEQIYQ